MVAMDVAAEKATELPRLGRPRMKLNEHASHTSYDDEGKTRKVTFTFCRTKSRVRKDEPVRIGERHRWSTLCRNLEPGIAPSRLKAYIIREFDVTEKVLAERARNKQSANVNTDGWMWIWIRDLTHRRTSPR